MHPLFSRFSSSARNKTFVPSRKRANTKRYQDLYRVAQASLGEQSQPIVPPPGDKREWFAVMADSFTNEAVLLAESVANEFCTSESCPIMNAGPNWKFLWQDYPTKKDTPIELPASEYVARCLDWILDLLDDESFFPQTMGGSFHKDFDKLVRKLFQRLVRIYAHWYRQHLSDFEAAGALPHLNSCFRHLYMFCSSQGLVDEKDWKPIQTEVAVIANGSSQ